MMKNSTCKLCASNSLPIKLQPVTVDGRVAFIESIFALLDEERFGKTYDVFAKHGRSVRPAADLLLADSDTRVSHLETESFLPYYETGSSPGILDLSEFNGLRDTAISRLSRGLEHGRFLEDSYIQDSLGRGSPRAFELAARSVRRIDSG